ncbi:amidohydrolase family protein [Mucilaginibacter sp.]|uniref:amidohydrolase family protein n=1 Tax=Mucilaginibacter sp. TaxID=1882438 RepID=UPI003D0E198B
MILNNVKMIGEHEPVNVRVANGKIAQIANTAFIRTANPLNITFKDAIIFPGLINSHDHLDFNLFPQLGDKTYNNYTEWGKYIHHHYKTEIAGVLNIPVLLRSEWGVFKNLLCGVTTVINHGESSRLTSDLISIFEDTQSLHSVMFEKHWKIKLNNPLKKLPVTIHVGEGSDWLAFEEINQLIRYNLLKKKLIGIHAVAMAEDQAKKFEALVWCPESNYFLLNKTARVDTLKNYSTLLFGTDSTLTGSWNIWEHLKLAKKTKLLNDKELYDTLTLNPAKIWKLNTGEIAEGKDADMVIARIKQNENGYKNFFATEPEDLLMVIHKGNIRLFDESILPQLNEIDLSIFSKVYMNGICRYIQGDLPELMEKIRQYQPSVNFPVNNQPD